MGGLLLALLALNVKFFYVAVECDSQASACARKNVSKMISFPDVTKFHFQLLDDELQSDSFDAILVGGGSPCQGNSLLNPRARGLEDERTQMFRHILRVQKEAISWVQKRDLSLPVVGLLENLTGPENFVHTVSHEFQNLPLVTEASDFGWVRRRRAWWISRGGAWCQSSLRLPAGCSAEWLRDQIRVSYQGKALPKKVFLEDGFAVHPKVAAGEASIFPFARCFPHPEDRCKDASSEAVEKFFQDGKRFTPLSYEEESLLWHASGAWRQPTAYDRAQFHLIPEAVLDALPRSLNSDAKKREAIKCSLIGNGFHVPSVVVILFAILADLAQATAVPSCIYAADEAFLRKAAWNSVWWPNVVQEHPALLSVDKVVKEIHEIFRAVGFDLPDIHAIKASMCKHSLNNLQSYFIDRVLRDPAARQAECGPDWEQQMHRAALARALGMQRFGPTARASTEPLVPDCSTKAEHISSARSLYSPFLDAAPVDDDLFFACRCMATLGPFGQAWRRGQIRAARRIAKALQPWNAWLVEHMCDTVRAVAGDKNPAWMAFEVVITRWTDYTLPARFVLGFSMVGHIEHTGLFRQLDVQHEGPTGLDVLLGESAVSNLESMRIVSDLLSTILLCWT